MSAWLPCSPGDARWGGSFGLGAGGADPAAMRGVDVNGNPYAAAGSLDAANECRHGRLPGDRSLACGCWVENAPRLAPAAPRLAGALTRGWTRERVAERLAVAVAELGREPTRDEWRALGWAPSAVTVARWCGSWSMGLAAARELAGRRKAA